MVMNRNTKSNRWKQSSAEFFNSLAKQARDWLDGNSSFPNPWSYKQWHKIRLIFKDTSLMPYQDKIDREKDNLKMDELRRKANAYDVLTNGNAMPETVYNPDDLDNCYL